MMYEIVVIAGEQKGRQLLLLSLYPDDAKKLKLALSREVELREWDDPEPRR